MKINRFSRVGCALVASAVLAMALPAFSQHRNQRNEQIQNHPWGDKNLSPDQRADMVLKEMTLDEKIDLVHGNGMPGWGRPRPNAYLGNGGAGFVLGVERLGIPMIQMSDAAYGVRSLSLIHI